ncbi:hypothetical protein HGA64_03470, partial [Candidatus Falkowbacteria bacterium]|nr:hypothetical protein [Candidatus Falkowbacteria bacterium]
MPNHLHVLLRVTDKSPNVPKLVQNGKRFLAYDIVRLLAEEGRTDLLDFFKANAQTKNGAIHKVFEDGYDSLVIQSRKMFLEKLNYIHNNPCALKWQLADCAEIYKHSSAANYAFGNGFYKVEVVDF